MTMRALATPPSPATSPTLRLIDGRTEREPSTWWRRRTALRDIVGGCPDHWWSPTARRTAACTCDRY